VWAAPLAFSTQIGVHHCSWGQLQERFAFTGGLEGTLVHAFRYSSYRAAAGEFERRFPRRRAADNFFDASWDERDFFDTLIDNA
jgi:hypothetical protein